MKRFGFPPEHRLRNSEDYKRTFQNRQSVADRWIVIYARVNQLPVTRMGMSVSRRAVGNATKRNRLRRLYREAFRLIRETLPSGLDLVIIPRRRSEEPTLEDLKRSLRAMVKKVARKLAQDQQQA